MIDLITAAVGSLRRKQVVDRLKEAGAKAVRIVCLLATERAIDKLRAHHPDVHVWTAAVDDTINDQGFILPGIGDVGDRMYGTR